MGLLSFFRKRGHKKAIVAILSDTRYEFRTLTAIAAVVGGDITYADELVGQLPTRRAYNKKHLVGLTSRIGATPRKREEIGWAKAVGYARVGNPEQLGSAGAYVPTNEEKLTSLLSEPKYRFRSYNSMIDATGLGTAALDVLLVKIGARRAVKGGREVYDSWGLISRVGAGKFGSESKALGDTEHQRRLAKLTELLSDPSYKFRSIETLRNKLGVNDFEIHVLLDEVKARPCVDSSGDDTDKYGLISRVGKGPNADTEDDDVNSYDDEHEADDFDDDDDDEEGEE